MAHSTDEPPVRVVSRAMVRPSHPTSRHPFFLSCLDILWQDVHYNQRLLFYERSGHDGCSAADVVQNLKSSLALCLVHYYPWCGRIAKAPLPPHRLFIDCNDTGVEFVEASSDLPLSHLAQGGFQMTPFFLRLSQSPDHTGDSLFRSPLLSIQVTLFSDGGLVVGIAQSHIVADGLSLWNFMVSWGQCARGVPLSVPPLHNRERLAVPLPSPEKAREWRAAPQKKEVDKGEEEMECVVPEKKDDENGSFSVEAHASAGDKLSPSMGTSSSHESDGSTNKGAVGEEARGAGEISLANGDITAFHEQNGHSSNGGDANMGHSGVHEDDKLAAEPLTDNDASSNSDRFDMEGSGKTNASFGGEPNGDPLVQCLLDLPSSAVTKLKQEAGETFSSFEVTCAHFWQRTTIARQIPSCDLTTFAVLADCRTRVTPPLSPAYFGNVISFCLAQGTAGKIGSESLCATASAVHEAIAATNEDRLASYMHWLEMNDNRFINDPSIKAERKGMNVASSSRFPVYQVDFGWGTPVAVRPVKAGGEAELVFFGGRPGSMPGDVEICTALPASALKRLLEDPLFLARPPCSSLANE